MTRDELCEVLKQSEDVETLLNDLIAAKRTYDESWNKTITLKGQLAAKQAYDETVNNILRRTYDDE